jgi:hypothetical protein
MKYFKVWGNALAYSIVVIYQTGSERQPPDSLMQPLALTTIENVAL